MSKSCEIIIDGKVTKIDGPKSISEVLKHFNFDKSQSISVNDEIIPHSHWESVKIGPGDEIEFI